MFQASASNAVTAAAIHAASQRFQKKVSKEKEEVQNPIS